MNNLEQAVAVGEAISKNPIDDMIHELLENALVEIGAPVNLGDALISEVYISFRSMLIWRDAAFYDDSLFDFIVSCDESVCDASTIKLKHTCQLTLSNGVRVQGDISLISDLPGDVVELLEFAGKIVEEVEPVLPEEQRTRRYINCGTDYFDLPF